MYKLLLFLKESDDSKIINHFTNVTLKHLSELSGNTVKVGKVESNLLLDTNYSIFCEIEAGSKDEMDKLMNTPSGRELSKDLYDFHNYVNVIYIDFNNKN